MQLMLTGRLNDWPGQGRKQGARYSGGKRRKKERKKRAITKAMGPWLRQKRESETSPD